MSPKDDLKCRCSSHPGLFMPQLTLISHQLRAQHKARFLGPTWMERVSNKKPEQVNVP